MRILVDAMGGDLAPDEIVKGAVHAQQELGAEIVLVGQRAASHVAHRQYRRFRTRSPGQSQRPGLLLSFQYINAHFRSVFYDYYYGLINNRSCVCEQITSLLPI